MRLFLAVLLLSVFSAALFGQTLSYTVDLRHTETTEVTVTVNIDGFTSKSKSTLSYQMPAWAPGAYSVTNYGRFIKNFKAFDNTKKELSVTQVDENRWEVSKPTKAMTITYSVTNSYKDSTSLYFALCHIDTNFFFANGTALFGYVNDRKDINSDVQYLSTFSVYSPLEYRPGTGRFGPKYLSSNYDELADAPVMAGNNLQDRTFVQDGASYNIILASDAPFPMDSLVDITKKIVKSQTDFFGDVPFKQYQFLINAPSFSKLPSQGLGALEHANSSAYLFFNGPWNSLKENFASILSHEFFHLWNVKRIHSDKLGPFDYTKRVMTTSLWLSEGITDYYANTLLSRSNILPSASFENKIAEWIGGMNYSRYTTSETLEQLSIDESDFDLGKALSFYTKGPLVGLMLDIEIRTRTNDKKSLDDIMHGLYAEAKKGIYFKDEELIHKIEKMAGIDLSDFYHRYIAGTDSLPLAAYLDKIGLIKDYKTVTETGIALNTIFEADADIPIIDTFFDESQLEAAGLLPGDTILSFQAGKPASTLSLEEYTSNTNAPQQVTFQIGREGSRFTKSISLTKFRSTHTEHKDIAPKSNPTPSEAKLRREVYGG
jgi:predicted metalloprotease with PDZ domain